MFSLLTVLDIEVKAKDKMSVTSEASRADWKSINLTSTGCGGSGAPSSLYLNRILDHHRSPWQMTPN